MTNTEAIVKADAVLPSREDVERQLDRLEASGDTQALNEVARQAAAYQEYESRAEAMERANFFGRVKVMAEARIGAIDLELHPSGVRGSELAFDGQEVGRATRDKWRMLGAGWLVGQLEMAVSTVEKMDDGVNTHRVAQELRELGAFWVSTAPILKRYREVRQVQGLTIKVVEERSGVRNLHQYLTRPGTTPQRDKMKRHLAIRVAGVLGLDPSVLESVRSTKPGLRGTRPRRQRKQRPLPGGRLDQTYVLIRKALAELDAAVGTSGKFDTDEAYDHLYKAEEIVGRALKRAT